MKKWVVMFSIFFVTSGIVNAQSMGRSYKTALGVKVWDGGGISFKTFVAPNNAMEVIGYFYRNGTRLTGLYEIHGDIADAAGLKWYIGPGAHLGFYNYKGYSGDKVVAGVDGVLGLDYKVNRAPINFSIDWQPSFEFAEGRGFVGSWGGLGIRYAF
ncbi:hypothetical protein [Segetibacter sp.]|uniref:hypothetical protein n=1 Tax=Segetibacter sp. TaxID=2231182 RepID=UPI002630CB0A|nr:hypothetical protein [Segetibacter sp.]